MANRTGLAAFFMGSENPGETFTDSEARQRRSYEILALSPASLKVIFDAAEYPSHYEDSIGKRFTAEDERKLQARYPSLSVYLDYVRNHPPIGQVRVRPANPR